MCKEDLAQVFDDNEEQFCVSDVYLEFDGSAEFAGQITDAFETEAEAIAAMRGV